MSLTTKIFATGLMGLGITVFSAPAADAGIYFGIGNGYYGGYGGFYNGIGGYGHYGGYGGYGGWRYPGARWNNYGHYDYYPGSYQRHFNHYDYIPGHYHYHNGRHFGGWGGHYHGW